MIKSLLVLLSALSALAYLFTPSAEAGLVVAGVAVAALILVAAQQVAQRDLLALVTVGSSGPSSPERCLRGSFRRQSNPDAAGRPRPRAPGSVLRPA